MEPVEEPETIRITNNGEVEMTEVTRTSLIVILVIVALIVMCCFGVGFFLICTYQIGKASKQVLEVR